MAEGKILSSSERWKPLPEDSPILESMLTVRTAEPFLESSLWIFKHFYAEDFLYQTLDPGFATSGQFHGHRAGTPFLSSPLYCGSSWLFPHWLNK